MKKKQRVMLRKKSKLFMAIISVFYIIFLIFTNCSTCDVKNNNGKTGALNDPNGIDNEYDKEGFISNNIYRVVIVKPISSGEPEIKSIKKNAKNRALISLQKYIISNQGIINQNVKAAILNLINEFGVLHKIASSHETRIVYHFDIKKSDLKRYVDDQVIVR